MLCSRSFAVAAPTTWNSLPLHIRNSSSNFSFRRQLKTFLYNLAFDPFLRPMQPPTHPSASDSVVFLQHCALFSTRCCR